MSYPIVLAVGRSGDTYSNLYCGSSLSDAQNALTAAVGTSADIGWVFQNPVPVATLRAEPAVAAAKAVPVEIWFPDVSDVPSAIGLSRVGIDGRTVNAGDEASVENAPAPLKDISGQQLFEAEQQMTSDTRTERHRLAKEYLAYQVDYVQKEQQDIEDQYATEAGIQPRDVTKDYTESSFVKEQREKEAQRAEQAFHSTTPSHEQEKHSDKRHKTHR